MPIHELAAVLAAACWALSGILSAGPVAHLGPVAFTRIRMAMVFVMLAIWVLATGSWHTIRPEHAVTIIVSGMIGVFIGDTLLFLAMSRVGPRRSSILFSTNAPISAVLGWLVLDETLTPAGLLGMAVAAIGVMLVMRRAAARAR